MILGVDEVGRGPWAGPLVVGAVVLGGAHIPGLTDSKKLSKKRREELNIEISKYTSEQIKRKIKADINFKRKVRSTKIFKEVAQHQEAYYKRENLFVDVLQSLAIWKKDNKQIDGRIRKSK